MTAVSTYNPTADSYLNGMLYGTKWGVNSLTFSFPTDATFYGTPYASGEPSKNFEAFNTAQQAGVRAVLQNYAAVTNLTFTEVTETATQHGELRYAESDSTSTATAYYPSASAVGGDAWFNNSGNKNDSPVKGNYAYLTQLHETGHTLGLKHSQDVKGSFAAMPADRDSIEYTVMSYRSYIGGPTSGYTLGATSYPQTLMMYDIAALQMLYGAKWSTNGGDTVYKWDPLSGQMSLNGVGQGAPAGNKIFMTIWDGGGQDTYDFSNYTTNLTVNLAPGGWTTTSTTQLASLGSGQNAAGNIANALLYQGNLASLIENAQGGSGSDSITGNVADNRLTGNGGNDTLDGGAGNDTAVYSGLQANYTLAKNADGSWTITDRRNGAPDGTDTLRNIELLQFADGVRSINAAALPANAAPVITSVAPSTTLAEWADQSASEKTNAAHTAAGTFAYRDADVGDVHGAAFVARGTGYIGQFVLNTGAGLSAGKDSARGLGWSFSVSDSAMDYLGAGQVLTQLYDVTISDGRGGTATQTVTITLIGAADTTVVVTPPPVVVTPPPVVVTPPPVVVTPPPAGTNVNTPVVNSKKDSGSSTNDSDIDGNALSATLGTLSFNADGWFSYTRQKDWDGTDSVFDRDRGGSMTSNVALVGFGVGGGAGQGSGLDSQDGDHSHDGDDSHDGDHMPLPVEHQTWHGFGDLNYATQSHGLFLG